ncbi:MAG: glycosyltransferase [Lachnospiraceae bacterium]|nr:glycosyltransferase [Lachnospiraceae bacterium]
MKPYVSFCISSYNRRDMIEELVTHLLSISREDIEVIVVDDCSSDNTIDMLHRITDPRLHVYCESAQAGGALCWFDALEKGNGTWLFQIIDRDWINTALVHKLICLLQEFEQLNVGFAVGGERISTEKDYEIFNEGLDTINEFGFRHSHPTGQIFLKKEWDAINDKRKYFAEERYGIYPHGYIYAIMGNSLKGAHLHIDICDKAHYNQRLIRTSSTVYTSRKDKTEWFWPESRFQLLKLACENIELVQDKNLYSNIILEKYIVFFFCVTQEWYINCKNEILKLRYNHPELSTNYIELLSNGLDYIILFREYLKKQRFTWADSFFYEALCKIDNELTDWLIKWTNEIRITEKMI